MIAPLLRYGLISAILLWLWMVPALLLASGPQVYVPAERYEFGVVLEGVVVSHVFSVHNQGDMFLEILKVVPA